MTREEAAKLVHKIRMDIFKHLDMKELTALDMAIEALADRPTGEWVKSDILPNGWHCSHCDAPVMTDDIGEMLFCPNCGSLMKKGD